MSLISDGLLFVTALTTGFYCLILASRLRRFARADDGIGPRIQALSAAVEEMRAALTQTQGRLDEMRRETALSGERMMRESARAKRVADDLSAATAEAERALDALYRADRGLAAATAGEEPRERGDALLEIERAPAPEDAGGPDLDAVEAAQDPDDGEPGPRPAMPGAIAPPAPSWAGGDVLKVERVAL